MSESEIIERHRENRAVVKNLGVCEQLKELYIKKSCPFCGSTMVGTKIENEVLYGLCMQSNCKKGWRIAW